MNPFRLPRWRFMNCCGHAWGHSPEPRPEAHRQGPSRRDFFKTAATSALGLAAFATLKVDLTEEDDPTAALRERFGVAGVPTYVLLGPDGQERRRLVGFVSPGEMLTALDAIDGAGRG